MLKTLLTLINKKTVNNSWFNNLIVCIVNFLKALPIIMIVIVVFLVSSKLNSCSHIFEKKQKETLVIELENKKQVIEEMIVINKGNAENFDKLKISNEITLSSLDKKSDDEKKILQKADKKTTELNKKIADIKDKGKDLPLTEENVKIRENAISRIMIESVWETYCANQKDEQCKG